MKAFIFTALVFFFCTLFLKAQRVELKGDGIISVHIYNYPVLEFYNYLNDPEPEKIIRFYENVEINSIDIKDLDSIRDDWFSPIHLHLDYGIFDFQCSEIQKEGYQIVINEETNLKYWIKKAKSLSYISWADFIVNTVAVIPHDSILNPVLSAPDPDGERVEKISLECLTPVEIVKDWLRVKVEPILCEQYSDMKEEDVPVGYIRWKAGNQLLIYYYLIF
jgi:hypothetical protein